jgi:DNA polymerase III sliding clamp (beta) subunit (PCNA family)
MDGLGAALIAAAGAPDKPQASAKADKADRADKADKAEKGDRGEKSQNGSSLPEEARIRLQFTSPTKPALITGSSGTGDESAPDYRYLVVPLRALTSA